MLAREALASLKGNIASEAALPDYQYAPTPDEYGDVKPPPRRLRSDHAFNQTSGTRSMPSFTFGAKPHKMEWGRVDTEYGPDLGPSENLVKDKAPSWTPQGRYKSVLVTHEWVPGPGRYAHADSLAEPHPLLNRVGRAWGFTSSLRPDHVTNDTPAPGGLPNLPKGACWSMTSKTEVGGTFKPKSCTTPGPGAYSPSFGGKCRQMPEHTFDRSSSRAQLPVGDPKRNKADPGPGAHKFHMGKGDRQRAASWGFGSEKRFGPRDKLPPREY